VLGAGSALDLVNRDLRLARDARSAPVVVVSRLPARTKTRKRFTDKTQNKLNT
jgi:hypothetical protein